MTYLEQIIVEILGDRTLSQKEVVERLRERGYDVNDRTLHKYYKSIRNRFAKGEIDFTILSNVDGNYISYDFNAIKKANNAYRKTAFAILKYAYARDKRIANDDQLTLLDYVKALESESGNGN